MYIMTNHPTGPSMLGVTNDIIRRAYEHRSDLGGFTSMYGLHHLVYFERHDEILRAIQREMNIKAWPRAWKVRLIHRSNSGWRHLYDDLMA